MSVHKPPIPDVATFNNLYWLISDTHFTIPDLDLLYLKYPVAQGTEDLQSINVNGAAAFNSNTDFTAVLPISTAAIPAANDSSTTIPTTAWVQSAIAGGGATDLVPNSITITPTSNPPDITSNILNFYNTGALYSLCIETYAYSTGTGASWTPGSRRQNLVDICWDNSIATNIYQNVVIDYKNWLMPETNAVAQPNNGTILVYDYGQIIFSIGWLKQQFAGGLNVNSTDNINICFKSTRGGISNGDWAVNANIQAQYYGTGNNRITLWYNNTIFNAGGYQTCLNTWSTFDAQIMNTGGRTAGSNTAAYPVWFEANTTVVP